MSIGLVLLIVVVVGYVARTGRKLGAKRSVLAAKD